ncbi:MAG: hypothetical protein JST11_24975 [Acidobacteria bacterium]|nr:hypothetical protein [Acidobacteriota bacterium]
MPSVFRTLTVAILCLPAFAQVPVTITAHPSSPGTAIPADFIGLSFESGSLASATSFPAENPMFRQMLAQIGPGMLRFGGNSVDKLTGWQASPRTASTPTSVLATSDVDRIAALARAVNWKILYSVGLGTADAASDAGQAQYVASTAADVLYGFEIGNEPDLFHSNGLRPSTYNVNDYLAEWQRYADALQAQVPNAVLTASAAAGSITTWTATVASKIGPRLALLTQHLYPLAPTSAVPSTAANVASIPHILGTTAHNTEDTNGALLYNIASGAHLPWRMAETNSCYNGGEKGVSNVHASALWGVDYMFTLAAHSAAGVNFHGGGAGNYTPIAVSGSQVSARPLYYALLFFRAAARGRIVPVDVAAPGINVTAYGVLDPDGSLRVVAVNKDLAQDAALTIAPGPGYRTALAVRLSGPSLDAVTGTTLGGAGVLTDGTWLPAALESAQLSGATYSTTVPVGGAILIDFASGALAAGNAAGGQPEAAPDGFVSAYGQGLSIVAAGATSPSYGTTLAGVNATLTDASGTARPASLAYVSPSQVNLLVPSDAAPGTATLTIGGASTTLRIAPVSPGLFQLNTAHVAAALAVRVANGQATQTPVPVFDCSSGTCRTVPIALDAQSTVYLNLYATGVRHAAAVTCTVGGVVLPVSFAGAQGTYPGLDQINVALPASLRGAGEVDVVVTADGKASNAVRIAIAP